MADVIGYTVLTPDERYVLRVGWRLLLEAADRYPEQYGDASIWCYRELADFDAGEVTPRAAVSYSSLEACAIRCSQVSGVPWKVLAERDQRGARKIEPVTRADMEAIGWERAAEE